MRTLRRRSSDRVIGGVCAVLVAVSGVLLIRQLPPWFEMGVVRPVIIAGGLLVVVTGIQQWRDRWALHPTSPVCLPPPDAQCCQDFRP